LSRWILFSIATITCAEFLLRILNPSALSYYRDVKLLHAYHSEYGVTLQANESRYVKHYAGLWEGRFTTNSLGLRGLSEPSPNLPKIFCLGDSMVMGFGVSDQDTFCSLLDGITINGSKHQALNLGVDAYGSLGDAKRLKDISNKVSNVKEVLFFISPNDFAMPEVLRNQGILPDDELDALHENDPVWKSNFRIQFEATRISYLLQALKLAYEQSIIIWTQNRLLAEKELENAYHSPLLYVISSFFLPSPKNTCKLETKQSLICPEPIPESEFFCDATLPDLNSLPPLTKTTTDAYDQMIELSKLHNFTLRPVIIPVQVEEIYCYVNGKHHSLGNYALRAKKFWNEKGIDVIDLTKYTKSMCGNSIIEKDKPKFSSIRDYFIPGDGHLTVLGNEWVARSLKQELGAKD